MCGEKIIQINHNGQEFFNFHSPTARQQGDNRTFIKPVVLFESGIELVLTYRIQQGITNVIYHIIIFFIEIHFKREDTEHVVNDSFDFMYPTLVPCPDFWGDIIADTDANFFCKFRYFKIKSWEIY